MSPPIALAPPQAAQGGLSTLIVTSPDLGDGSAWWRALGPWGVLKGETPGLDILPIDMATTRPSWTPIGMAQAVYLCRPHSSTHVQFMDSCAASGLPVVVDFDDCVWEIPRYHESRSAYNQERQTTINVAAQRAFKLVTSTPDLRDYILKNVAPDADVRVIPNALPDFYTWQHLDRRKILLYRGGNNHLGDIYEAKDAIVEAMRARPDWTFVSVGRDPWFIHEKLERSEHVERMDLPQFHRWLRNCCASVMIAPWADNVFNRCKSSIVWLEGSLAGAAVLASALPEFDRPGCTTYEPGEMGSRLAWLLDEADRGALVQASRDWIDQNARLSVTNRMRLQLLAELLA